MTRWIILALLALAYYWWRSRTPQPYVPHDPKPPSPIKREEQSADPVAEAELGDDKPIDPDGSKPGDPDKDPAS